MGRGDGAGVSAEEARDYLDKLAAYLTKRIGPGILQSLCPDCRVMHETAAGVLVPHGIGQSVCQGSGSIPLARWAWRLPGSLRE